VTRLVALLAIAALVVTTLAMGARADARATSTPHAGLEAPIPAQLVPGTTAVVATGDGDCLRIRSAPSLQAIQIACAEDGSEVTVLTGTSEADGFTWQYIRQGSVTGWAADLYLVTAAAAPVPQPTATPVAPPAPEPTPTPEPAPVCDTRGTSPGLFGSIPPQGGSALLVSGGGTSAGIVHQAALRGVTLRSLWVLNDAGNWIAYVVGAPDFVNQRWYDHFPGGRIPSSTALFAIAEAPGTSSTTTGGSIAPPLIAASAPRHVGGPAPEVDSGAAIVVDAASGAVLHEHNARTRLPPASLTKIVTAVLAIEGSDLESRVSVDGNFSMLAPDSSLMGLDEGDCFSVRDLLYGLMLRSGNDAALAIARHVAGSDEAFVASMNAFVDRLGLSDTQFGNPHGLHDDLTYSSAYDMAMLTRYAMTLPTFEAIAGEHSWTTSGSRVFLMRTLNSFLSSYDDGDGVKTGFTEEAGRTLVASATRDGRRVIAVLLDAPDRATDAAALIEWAFTEHDWPR
jgi:D-alanyl-D-alanine carboxypeptidase